MVLHEHLVLGGALAHVAADVIVLNAGHELALGGGALVVVALVELVALCICVWCDRKN